MATWLAFGKNKSESRGVVKRKTNLKSRWERVFEYAFSEHEKIHNKVFSFILRGVLKPYMFGIETRISFFAGIKANDDTGGLQGFLDSQRYICRELKSSYLPFYDDLSRRYGPDSLYKTIKPYYPPAEVSIFSAGETSNNMKTACDVAITFIERSYEIKNKVKGFVGMLAFYIVAFTVFIVVFTDTITDQLVNLERQMQTALPPVTQFYMSLNEFLQSYIALIAIILILLVGLFVYSLPRGTGKVRQWLHRWMPGYRFYRRYTSCSFLLSLSAMLGAGMSFNEAIKTVRLSNALGSNGKDGYVSRYMADVQRKLNSGAKQQRSLDVDFMPKSMYLNVSQFIKGKDIGLTLLNVAEFELDSLSRKIDKYKRYLNIAIMAIGGLIVINGYKAAIEPALVMFTNTGY
jgi:type II secretory pathway component PulF